MNYYNDHDPFICEWLGSLIDKGLIPPGQVDNRSIRDIDSLEEFEQHHFFAGIGGWSYALELAGWPDGLSVWTGSCPCQSFSGAGHRRGFSDERDLWPEFLKLITQYRPSVIFGEQITGGDGRLWFGRLYKDLKSIDYEVVSAIISADCLSAPHRRRRLFFVGYTASFMEHAFKEMETFTEVSLPLRSRWTPWNDRERLIYKKRHYLTEPGVFPLAHGVPQGMELLKGYGNAIVPQIGALFIRAFMEECRQERNTAASA